MKKVFAVSAVGGDYVTAFRMYEVVKEDGGGFVFVADDGSSEAAAWRNSAHICGWDWARVELDVPPAKVDEAHLETQQIMHKFDTLIARLKSALADVGEVMP